MRIPDEQVATVVREHIRSREWYCIVTDDEATSLRLAMQMFMCELAGRLTDDDTAGAVIDFVTPQGRKAVVTYLGVKKSSVPAVFFRHLLTVVKATVDLQDPDKDLALISQDEPMESAAFIFMASVESGKITTQRTGGMN